MSVLTEIVYKNADNPNIVTFFQDGVPMDFSITSRMVLTFNGAGVSVDSNSNPPRIDWSGGSGEVVFDLGDVAIAKGSYPSTLKVYDGTHPDGQVITHPQGTGLTFKFV